jgi:hypothetical protein
MPCPNGQLVYGVNYHYNFCRFTASEAVDARNRLSKFGAWVIIYKVTKKNTLKFEWGYRLNKELEKQLLN